MSLGIPKNNRGFTLVESLVAIAILSISILGTYTAVQNSLQFSTIAKDQITAFYLAQEGMEFIKNVRDENALWSINSVANSGLPRSWIYGLSSATTDPCWYGGSGTGQKTCTIDSNVGFDNAGVVSCGGGFGSCANIKQDTTTGLFGYSSGGTWVATNFKREIQFTQNSANEVVVTISIIWTTRGTTKSFQITQLLFNRE